MGIQPHLVSTVCFHVFINKDIPISFINGKMPLPTTYKETDKLLNRCALLPIAIVNVPVQHICSVANQAV